LSQSLQAKHRNDLVEAKGDAADGARKEIGAR
jgi:hypothetical protein